jgi:hypothetical protein
MNYEIRIDPMFKLFNQSIARLRFTKTKSLILGSLLVGALVALLSAPLQAAEPAPLNRGGKNHNTFSILLSGPYKAVAKGHGPPGNLGLTTVDLSDGSYSKTKIFHVEGRGRGNRPGNSRPRDEDRIGTFYVQFDGSSVAYDLPGGAIAMVFTSLELKPVPDGQGGTYLVGTAELDITEANGRYKSFVGGHNTMVDILHQLADGTFVEHCICIISRKV